MTRNIVRDAFDCRGIRSALAACAERIPPAYQPGTSTDDAMQRLKDLEALFEVSSIADLGVIYGQHNTQHPNIFPRGRDSARSIRLTE